MAKKPARVRQQVIVYFEPRERALLEKLVKEKHAAKAKKRVAEK